jgi:hypothetical protein
MSRYCVLVYGDCGASERDGSGPSGDFLIASNVLTNLSLQLQNRKDIDIIFISRPGGVIKMRKLFRSAGDNPSSECINIDGQPVRLLSVEDAKRKVNHYKVSVFIQAGRCQSINDKDLCKLINQETQVVLIANSSSSYKVTPYCFGELFPSLVSGGDAGRDSVEFKVGMAISSKKLGLHDESAGYPLAPYSPVEADPTVERYRGKEFGFGYYASGHGSFVRGLENYFWLMTEEVYKVKNFVIVSPRNDELYRVIENYFSNQELGATVLFQEYGSDQNLTRKTLFTVSAGRKLTPIGCPVAFSDREATYVIDHYLSAVPNAVMRTLSEMSVGFQLATGTMSLLESFFHRNIPAYMDVGINGPLLQSYMKALEAADPKLQEIARVCIYAINNASFRREWDRLGVQPGDIERLKEINARILAAAVDKFSDEMRTVAQHMPKPMPTGVSADRMSYYKKLGVFQQRVPEDVLPCAELPRCYQTAADFAPLPLPLMFAMIGGAVDSRVLELLMRGGPCGPQGGTMLMGMSSAGPVLLFSSEGPRSRPMDSAATAMQEPKSSPRSLSGFDR